MRISRPCYDKMHRCPGWAGGGVLYSGKDRCDNGRLRGGREGTLYAGRFWRWRFNRCDTCDVVVLPYMVRWLDWRWIAFAVPRKVSDVRFDLRRWREDMLWSSYAENASNSCCKTPGFAPPRPPWMWRCPECGSRWLRGRWPKWLVRLLTDRSGA